MPLLFPTFIRNCFTYRILQKARSSDILIDRLALHACNFTLRNFAWIQKKPSNNDNIEKKIALVHALDNIQLAIRTINTINCHFSSSLDSNHALNSTEISFEFEESRNRSLGQFPCYRSHRGKTCSQTTGRRRGCVNWIDDGSSKVKCLNTVDGKLIQPVAVEICWFSRGNILLLILRIDVPYSVNNRHCPRFPRQRKYLPSPREQSASYPCPSPFPFSPCSHSIFY